MISSKIDYYNAAFSHIYVEKQIKDHQRTKEILKKLPDARVIEIDHYKDVFCRRKQSIVAQNKAKALILAKNQNGCIYEGASGLSEFWK